jgi:hypothetical protein
VIRERIMLQLSELWRELVAHASEEERAEAAVFWPYVDDLSRRLQRQRCRSGEPAGAPPPLATQPYTIYQSAADYAKQVASGNPAEGGTSLIDPVTGLAVGVVDANGDLHTGSATANLETVDADNSGKKDCAAVFEAAVGPEGTIFANEGIRARFPKEGRYRLDRYVDLHPSISLRMDARGGILVVPARDLPATTPDGAPAALLRVVRRTPDSSKNLAWASTFSGFNLDFRGAPQTYPVHGIRVPSPDPSINPIDPDPAFGSNKDYVAGRLEFADIIGASGTGYLIEPANGRFDVDSARAMNCGLNGFELLGNDVVFGGHWGAGGCGQFGVKVGQAAGFLATTGNVWGNPAMRSLTCGAMWINRRMSFAVGFTVFNDWVRLDGGQNSARGGVFALNSMATHEENFSSEGIAIDAGASGDPRLQSFFGVGGYKSANFICNSYLRTTPVTFPTWMNVGGDLAGGPGTAFNNFIDASNFAQVNCIDTINSGPDVRPWTGNQAAFTVSIGAPAVCSSTAHGLKNGWKLALTTTGDLPKGLDIGVAYYVVNADANTFQLARKPGGEAIATSGTQSGKHTWGNLSTLPYNARGGAQVNYLLMDSYTCETRIGARGPTHSKVLIGIADGDFGTLDAEGNRIYQVEIGDRLQAADGNPYRHAAYGLWEFGNAVQYLGTASDRRGIKAGAGRVVKPGQAFQFFSTADKGISDFTITLPQGQPTSHELVIVFTGGGIGALQWSAKVADRSRRLPDRIDGYTVLRLLYSADIDAWQLLASHGGSLPYVALPGEGSIVTDCSTGANFLATITADASLANPTNGLDGRLYNWLIVEDATGDHKFSLAGKKFKVPSGLSTAFATGPNAVNKLTARYCAALDQFHVETFGAALA